MIITVYDKEALELSKLKSPILMGITSATHEGRNIVQLNIEEKKVKVNE